MFNSCGCGGVTAPRRDAINEKCWIMKKWFCWKFNKMINILIKLNWRKGNSPKYNQRYVVSVSVSVAVLLTGGLSWVNCSRLCWTKVELKHCKWNETMKQIMLITFTCYKFIKLSHSFAIYLNVFLSVSNFLLEECLFVSAADRFSFSNWPIPPSYWMNFSLWENWFHVGQVSGHHHQVRNKVLVDTFSL